MNGFELCEKILELDINIRVCFMTPFVVNIPALTEVYTNVSFGCFIEKPVTMIMRRYTKIITIVLVA